MGLSKTVGPRLAVNAAAPDEVRGPSPWREFLLVTHVSQRRIEFKSLEKVLLWVTYTRGFGPLRQLAESLPPDRVQRLKHDVDAYHRHYAVPAGLHMKREYLLTIGWRR